MGRRKVTKKLAEKFVEDCKLNSLKLREAVRVLLRNKEVRHELKGTTGMGWSLLFLVPPNVTHVQKMVKITNRH